MLRDRIDARDVFMVRGLGDIPCRGRRMMCFIGGVISFSEPAVPVRREFDVPSGGFSVPAQGSNWFWSLVHRSG
jgi:hypothetical protein